MSSDHRILLVEDSETQALRLEFLFAEQGWQTERASTAEEAVDKLERIVPDLIILDHYLPGLKGVELCKLIRRNANGWNPSILMFTAEDASAVQSESLESGADDYLSKSADDSILLLRVRTLLRKSENNRRTAGKGNTGFRQARLLAVDDSPSYLQYLVHELSSDGHTVEAANNGPDALEKITLRGYDCVLLDIVMPGMDGIEVCQTISQMGANLPRHPLVLMLTAHENPSEMARGLESGADDFVGKSSDVTVVKSRVRALLRRKLFQDALKDKEIEILRVQAAREAAELKADLVGQITEKNRDLEETNRRLKETQMHLVHTANMASLGQLVAGIAHEINNPISFIDNNCYLITEKLEALAEGCDAFLSPAHKKLIQSGRERLSEARMGLERVKELIGKLRTFSRLDEGEFKKINVHESIDSVLLLLQHRNRRITVDKQFTSDPMLNCAPGQLNQVLMNILANAMDAIGDQPGKITICTSVQEGWYCIAVRDSGAGVPVAIRPRLFQPFFTTKPVGSGTGLGLAISHSIIRAHRGQIDVLSPDGGGAEFRIRIPLNLSQEMVHAIYPN
ncbi:MAG TPA: response regulator [Bryobacteraceae bacterium]|nr:response regulator [Bryobacteraceae bacterium]